MVWAWVLVQAVYSIYVVYVVKIGKILEVTDRDLALKFDSEKIIKEKKINESLEKAEGGSDFGGLLGDS